MPAVRFSTLIRTVAPTAAELLPKLKAAATSTSVLAESVRILTSFFA